METMEIVKEEKRKMCVVAEIEKITPIEGADRIVIANVKGKTWNVIVKKDEYQIGDKCAFFEIDSLLQDGLDIEIKDELKKLNVHKNKNLKHGTQEYDEVVDKINELKAKNTIPHYEFLRQSNFRIKTIKLRGVYSQGFILDLKSASEVMHLLGKDISEEELRNFEIETDLTDLLEVEKYEEAEKAILGGSGKNFPGFIMKTSETRIENMSSKYETLKKYKWRKLQKLEGSSMTVYLNEGVFGVCSHNLEIGRPDLESDEVINTFWKVAIEHNMEEKFRKYSKDHNIKNFYMQMECIGEGIQGNIYKLKGHTCGVFISMNLDTQKYDDISVTKEMAKEMDLPMAEIVEENVTLPETIEEIMLDADKAKITLGKSKNILSEGYIYVMMGDCKENIERSNLGRLSFKAKSRRYLLKHA